MTKDFTETVKSPSAPKNQAKTIVLLGDSTLDNKTWTKDKPCVTEHLENLFSEPKPKVLNYAVDCFQTSDILNKISNRGSNSMKVTFDHPHFEKGSQVNVLEKLSETEAVSHIVLSIGGNDLRNKLASIRSMQDLVACVSELQENYLEIIERLRESKPNAQLILMTQYAVDSTPTHDTYGIYALLGKLEKSKTPIQVLYDLMNQVYAPIFAKAAEYNIPIINMEKSLAHTDTNNFISQIEPSSQASLIIASLIKTVVEEHEQKELALMWWHSSTGIKNAPIPVLNPGFARDENSAGLEKNAPSSPSYATMFFLLAGISAALGALALVLGFITANVVILSAGLGFVGVASLLAAGGLIAEKKGIFNLNPLKDFYSEEFSDSLPPGMQF